MVEKRYAFLAVERLAVVLVLAGDGGNGLLKGSRFIAAGGLGPAEGIAERSGVIHGFDPVDGLGQERICLFGLGGGGNGVGYGLDGVAIGLPAFFLSRNPGVEIRLFLLFASDDVELLEGEFLALPLLPAVGRAGILAGILQCDGRVGHHCLPHDVLTDGTGVDGDTLLGDHLLELGCGLEPLGASGIAHDHGEVTVLVSLEGDAEGAFGLVGDVVRAVCGRLVVAAGIYAEHREVAGVAGPHPVVGLAAELSGGCRRSADETDVGVSLVDNEVEDVVVVEALDPGRAVRVVSLGLFSEGLGCGFHGGLGYLFLVLGLLVGLEGGLIGLLQHGGDVGHALQEGDTEASGGQLFLETHRPVSVLEIVVLGGGERLDVAVSAVVVGDDESLVGDHLSGASASEMDDGVFEGGVVDAVDLFGCEAAAELRHCARVHLLEKREQPHAFIRAGADGERHGRRESEKDFLHVGLHMLSNSVGSNSLGWKLFR